jgi:hypothetical protein
MAARILASYGAQNTSRATVLRAELIESIYRVEPRRRIPPGNAKPRSPMFMDSRDIPTIERFSKCIDWLLGGIHKLSPLEDDKLFWRISTGNEGNLNVISMEKRLQELRKKYPESPTWAFPSRPAGACTAGELMFPNSPKSQKIS